MTTSMADLLPTRGLTSAHHISCRACHAIPPGAFRGRAAALVASRAYAPHAPPAAPSRSCPSLRLSLLPGLAALFAWYPASPVAADKPTRAPLWTHWRGPSGQGYVRRRARPADLERDEERALEDETARPRQLDADRLGRPRLPDRRQQRTAASATSSASAPATASSSGSRPPRRTCRPARRTHWNGYASASCATDGKHVYAFFGTPGLFCYDLDGKLLWKHERSASSPARPAGAPPRRRSSSRTWSSRTATTTGRRRCRRAPRPAAAPMALVALDKKTGKVRWTTPRNQGRGFSTPRLMPTAGGRLDLVLNGPLGVVRLRPEDRQGTLALRPQRRRATSSSSASRCRSTTARRCSSLSGRPGPCQALKLPGDGDVTQDATSLWHGEPQGPPRRGLADPVGRPRLRRRQQGRAELLRPARRARSCTTSASARQRQVAGVAGRACAASCCSCWTTATRSCVEPGAQVQGGRRATSSATARARLRRLARRRRRPAVPASQSHLYCIGEKK